VQGVSKDEGALGYFGYAYYEENAAKLKDVAIDAGKGAIKPSPETIKDGTYAPLSRPLFIYVSTKAAARPEVKAFVNYYLENAGGKASEVGYVGLPEDVDLAARKRFWKLKTGSVYGGNIEGASLEKLYGAQ
jgi:phosphate transport system substrate-binding protein